MPRETDINMGRYLQHLAREWIREHRTGADEQAQQKELADKIGVSPAHVSGLLSSGTGGGPKTQRGFAAIRKVPLWQLTKDCEEWLAQNPPAAAASTLTSGDPYPNRARALEIARDLEINAEAIAFVAALPGFKSNEDPSIAWWVARIELEAARIEGTAPRRTGVVLTPDPPPRGRKGAP